MKATLLLFKIGFTFLFVGFIVFNLGLAASLGLESVLPMLTDNPQVNLLTGLIIQLGGGLLALFGLVLCFNAATLRGQVEALRFREQTFSRINNSFASMEKNLSTTLTSLTRRVDNSYKLLDERIVSLESALRNKGIILPTHPTTRCKFCNSEIYLDSVFCPECGRAQK